MKMDMGTCSPSAALLRREPPRPVSSSIPLDRYYSIADGVLNQANSRPPHPCLTHQRTMPRARGDARPRSGLGGWRGTLRPNPRSTWCARACSCVDGPHACHMPWLLYTHARRWPTHPPTHECCHPRHRVSPSATRPDAAATWPLFIRSALSHVDSWPSEGPQWTPHAGMNSGHPQQQQRIHEHLVGGRAWDSGGAHSCLWLMQGPKGRCSQLHLPSGPWDPA